MILSLLSYVGIVLGFLFLTLSIASGLYYVSELVEEHTVSTKKFLTMSIYVIVGIYVLLLVFDSFPWKLVSFSIFTQWVYYQNLKRFPMIEFTSLSFLASCVLVVVNHFLWFKHFSQNQTTFAEVASFFGVCVWFVPFALFVSLSAGDNVLPSTTHYKKNDDVHSSGRNQGLAKVIIGTVRDWIYKVSRSMGYELDPNHGRII